MTTQEQRRRRLYYRTPCSGSVYRPRKEREAHQNHREQLKAGEFREESRDDDR